MRAPDLPTCDWHTHTAAGGGDSPVHVPTPTAMGTDREDTMLQERRLRLQDVGRSRDREQMRGGGGEESVPRATGSHGRW